ncbi:DNA-3-methyladenine glycosylase II [Rhodovulum sp. PH10]|uniref:DNA-3-methyladenine glycosylase family protein n=1 Tax=Rhodovulum sp. PH10 TaxID=1187851 RepID=UPI00027C29C9|nr:DNA-3-methyladenine glycosylase [Rhodovulum sp. PH10]EJW12976.1 DNA-3-methyladenine glycosylase II [Rhodovulum sp. PH10]
MTHRPPHRPPHRLDTEADIARGLAGLLAADPRLAPVVAVAGEPPLRRRPAGFAGLVATVLGQQLSIASAAAIGARLFAAYDPFEPAVVAQAEPATLARIGLSAAKIKSVKAIAAAIAEGALDLDGLADLAADEAHQKLVAVHGIGPWTADSYLLFCLGHADAWPAGDLALQEAARLAFGLDARPTAKAMAEMAEAWRPWRGVAAFLLWGYYRVVKQRDPVLPAPVTAVSRT